MLKLTPRIQNKKAKTATHAFLHAVITYGTFLFVLQCSPSPRITKLEKTPSASQKTTGISQIIGNPSATPTQIPDTSAPEFSADATSSEIGPTSFKVNWEKGSDTVTAQKDLEYKIVYGTESSILSRKCAGDLLPTGVSLLTNWTRDLTKASLTDLNPNTSYQIAILVRDAAGNTNILGPRTVTTNKANAPTTGAVASFAKTTSSGVQLAWGAAQDSGTASANLSYRVVMASSPGEIDSIEKIIGNMASDVSLVKDWSANLTALNVGGLTSGSTNYFAVVVKDADGNYALYPPTSMQTPTDAITVPEVSENVETASATNRQSAVTIEQITASVPKTTLSWPAAVNNANPNEGLLYKLVKASAKTSIDSISEIEVINGADVLMDWTANTTSAEIPNLTGDTAYYFGILVKDSTNNVAIYNPVTYVPSSFGPVATPTPVPTATPVAVVISTTAIPTATPTTVAVNTPTPTPTIVSSKATVSLLAVGGASGNLFKTSPISLVIAFSKSVTGFTASDIVATNGTIGNFSGSGSVYSAKVTPLADGLVTLNIGVDSALDSSGLGNNASAQVSLTLDTSAPSIAVTSPANNSYIGTSNNSSTFAVSGTCSETSQSVTIKVDSSSSGTGAACNGATYLATIDTTGLSEAAHIITAAITDTAGNTTTSSLASVTKDITPPVSAVITTLANNTYINPAASIFTFSGSCTESGQQVDIKVDGTTSGAGAICNGTTYSAAIDTTSLSDTTHTINSVITDTAGNVTTSTPLTIIKDASAPSVAITLPANNILVNTANNNTMFVIEGTCSENGHLVTVKIDGTTTGGTGNCDTGTFVTTINTTILSDAIHSLTAIMGSDAGKTTTSSVIKITKDVTAPSVAITSPVYGSYINITSNGADFAVNGTCSETGQTVTIKVDGTANGSGAICNGTTYAAVINTSALSEALHSLTASLTDTAAYTTTSSAINVTKDITAPITDITTPATNSYLNLSSSNFTVSGNCDQAGETVSLKIDGITNGSGATCNGNAYFASLNTSLFSNGAHALSAAVSDNAGNETTSSSITIIKDTSAPSIAITSPANNSYVITGNDSTTFAVSGTCSEVSKLVSLEIDGTASGTPGTCNGTTFAASINTTVLSAESHAITAIISNAAGKTTTSSAINLIRDLTSPTIAVTSPGNNSFINSTTNSLTFAISGTCSEASKLVTIRVDGVVKGSGGSCTGTTYLATIDSSTLADGVHSLTASITDSAGYLTASPPVTITKDITPPAITIISGVDNNTYINTTIDTFTFSGSCTELEQVITVKVDGVTNGAGTTCNGSTYSATVDTSALTDATHLVTVVVSDTAGNTSVSAPLSLIIDAASPIISITTPTNAGYINIANNGAAFIVSGTCSEASQLVSIKVDGSASGVGATCDGSNYSATIDTTGLSVALHSLVATITSVGGKVANSNAISVTKDVSAPSIAISTPGDASYINNTTSSATFAVNGTCNENGRAVIVKVDGATSGSGATCTSTTFAATIDTTSMSGGAHVLTAVISDVAGNATTSAAINITKDLNYPSIAITSPSNAGYINASTNGGSFTVSGICSDAARPVAIKVNGSTSGSGATCNGTTFSATIDTTLLAATSHTLAATISNVAGNSTTSSTINITKDITAPVVTITTPANASYINAANTSISFAVSGSCNENGKVVTLKVDGNTNGSGATCNGTSYAATINTTGLSDAAHSLTAIISDGAGNQTTSSTVSITKDISLPNLAITSPLTSSYINIASNSATFSVSGTCSEASQNVTIKVDSVTNGSGATCNGTTFTATIDTTSISIAAHALTALISDAAGNAQTSSVVNVTKDISAPASVAITSPAEATLINTGNNSATFAVSGTCSEASLTVLIKVNGTTNGLGATCNGTTFAATVDTTGVPNGSPTLIAVITDAAGNATTSSTITLTKNVSAPTISITSPANNTYVNISNNSATFVVSGACSENGKTVTVNVDATPSGVGATCNGTSYSAIIDTTLLTVASHSLTTSVTNDLLNTSTSTAVTVTKDVTAPSVAITSPANSSFINAANTSATFVVSGTCSEAGKPVTIKVDTVASGLGATCDGAAFSATIDTTSLSSAAHSLTAAISDAAGNATTSGAISVTKDISLPSIAITSPIDSSFINIINDNSSFSVSGTCTETSQAVTIKVDTITTGLGGTCDGSAFSAVIDSTSLTAASHSLTAVVGDAAGNATTSSAVSITKDVTAPSVAISVPAASSYINIANNGATFTVSGTCSENGANVTVKVDGTTSGSGATCTTGSYSATIDTTGLADGVRSLTTVTTDAAGNSTTSATISVTKDAIAPSLAITGPANNSYINIISNSATFAVSGTCSEASKTVTIKVDGTTSGVGATCTGTTFAATISTTALSAATHTITAVISDSAGNSITSGAITVTKDITAPTIAVSIPAASSYISIATNTASFTVSGTCNETSQAVTIKVDGSTSGAGATCTGTTFSGTVDTTGLAEGAHSFTALISDAAGNPTTSSAKTATKDITSPTVAISVPAASSYINIANNTATFTVSGTCSENTKVVTIKVDGTTKSSPTCTTGAYTTTFSVTALTEGARLFTATHADAATNSTTSATVTVTKDTTAPSAAITSPAASSYINNINNSASFTVSGTCNASSQTVTIQVDGVTNGAGAACTGTTFSGSINTTGVAEGTRSLTAIISDAAGNPTTSSAISVTKDTTPPVVGTTPTFASVTGTTMTVNWGAATDAVTAQASLQYKLVWSTASANIDTMPEADAITGASLAMAWTTNTLTANVTGLSGNTLYYFGVLTKDTAGSIALYTVASKTTLEGCIGTVGAACASGAIYLGSLTSGATSGSGMDKYMTTPGGCGEIPAGQIVGSGASAYPNADFTPTCSGADTLVKYWNDGSVNYYFTGVNSPNYGDKNTANIAVITTDINGGYHAAARYCDKLSYAGYTDWYLPNIAELSLFYTNKTELVSAAAGLSAGYYWSSTDVDGKSASARDISTGLGGAGVGLSKSFSYLVRCVRRDFDSPKMGTGLTFASVSGTSLTVNWGTATDDATAQATLQYKLVKATAFASLDTVAEADALVAGDLLMDYTTNTLTKAVTGLTAGATTYFAVLVKDSDGNKALYTPASQDIPTDCSTGSPTPGTICTGGTIYVGTLSPGASSSSGTDKYMTTPGGCGQIPAGQIVGTGPSAYPNADFTPTCSGFDSLYKYWNNGVNYSDIAELTNYTTTTGTTSGATNTDVYYGGPGVSTNTSIIAAITDTTKGGYYAAARYCDKLSYAGYTDWYLPNRYELNLLYTNKTSISGLNTGYYYWSSTEYSSSWVWNQIFNTGSQGYDQKGTSKLVRCVRRESDAPNLGAILTFSSTTTTSITVSWGAASDTVTATASLQYKLVKASDFASIDTVAEVDAIIGGDVLMDWTANTLTKDVTGLTTGTNYYFAILVKDGDANKALYLPASQSTYFDCLGGSPAPGVVCNGGAIFLGTLSPGATSGTGVDNYMTTPGGCGEIPGGQIVGSGVTAYANADFTPTCSGTDSLSKSWDISLAGATYDVPELVNYTTTGGAGFGAVNKDLNYGSTNTAILASINETSKDGYYPAARYCDKLNYGGYTDWYLPNRYELNLFFTNKNALVAASAGLLMDYYWSSTEFNLSSAWVQTMAIDYQAINSGYGASMVRCVRRYSNSPTIGGLLTFSSIASTSLTVNWGAGTDSVTSQASLQYRLVKALDFASIDTVAEADAITGSDLIMDWTSNTLTGAVTGLTTGTTYYFAVLVKDGDGNKTLYPPARQATPYDCSSGTPTPGITCSSGAIFLGTLSPGATSGVGTDKYMTTPGGCGEIPAGQIVGSGATAYPNADFTPTCSGADYLTKTWNDGLTNYYSFGTSDINYGDTNTTPLAAITASEQGGYHAAARYCDKLNYAGYTDWYLPNTLELNLLYTNAASIPGLAVGSSFNIYWSSVENRYDQATSESFYNGSKYSSSKNANYLIRCVRRDSDYPNVGTSVTLTSVVGTSATVNWGAASDAVTSQASLQYKLVKASAAANIDTVTEADAITGADLLMDWSPNTLTNAVTGLTAGTTTYFAVLVKDGDGNKSLYTLTSIEIPADCLTGSPTPGTLCSGGTIFLGTLTPGANSGSGTDTYMTTPGGCGEIPAAQKVVTAIYVADYPNADFTPTCTGTDYLEKTWNNYSTKYVSGFGTVQLDYDVPSLVNYTTGLDQNYGSTNTANLVAANASLPEGFHSAAQYCDKLSYGGYTDWYLPNITELNLFYVNKASIPGLRSLNGYGSSTEQDNQNAMYRGMSTGTASGTAKWGAAWYFRCVRRISDSPSIGTVLTFSSVSSNSLTVNWGAASDGLTSQTNLQYKLVKSSTFAGTDTIAEADAISGADLLMDWTTNTLTASVTGLTVNTTYYFAVLVKDADGNKTLYSPVAQATYFDCVGGSPTPGTICSGGTIYLGSLSPGATSGTGTDKYMTTPGGCGEITPIARVFSSIGPPYGDYPTTDFTPTCSGTDYIKKYWNNGSSNNADNLGLINYTSTEASGYGATNTDYFYGSANTANIVAVTGTTQGGYHAAARYCDKLNYGGYTDWYLPNRYELNLFYTNKASIPGLVSLNGTYYYWSSSEGSVAGAWYQKFWDGSQAYGNGKNTYNYVRCVRRY